MKNGEGVARRRPCVREPVEGRSLRNLKDKMRVESEMNLALRRLGLTGWTVVWDPEHSDKARGLILPDDKIILISDENEEAAFETLAHEYLELRLQAMNKAKTATINALLKALEKIYYREKEGAIDSLTPVVLRMMRENVEKTGGEGEEASPS